MAGTRTVNGLNTTYKFEWTSATARIDAIADGAAHQLWNDGYGNHAEGVLYVNLTVTQKLAMLDLYLAKVLTDLATTYKITLDRDAAMVAAGEYAKSNYEL